jgi:hypothetical protein
MKPPYTSKYVRWCGRTGPRGPSYPILSVGQAVSPARSIVPAFCYLAHASLGDTLFIGHTPPKGPVANSRPPKSSLQIPLTPAAGNDPSAPHHIPPPPHTSHPATPQPHPATPPPESPPTLLPAQNRPGELNPTWSFPFSPNRGIRNPPPLSHAIYPATLITFSSP